MSRVILILSAIVTVSANALPLVKTSKFKDIPGYGETESGHILLQDHGSPVCFRNIKIRVL